MSTGDIRFKPVADRALLVELATEISDEVNQHVLALDRAIAKAEITGLIETTPALVNLLVVFDPLITDHLMIKAAIEALLPTNPNVLKNARSHVLAACYEEEISPDLAQVAYACGLSSEELINLHTSTEFRVGMYGFIPGFAYLTSVPVQIQIPRKQEPVRGVPKGSIMIAGAQCSITSMNTPSGWHVVGRTDADIIREDADQAFLFEVGDTVRFERVSLNNLRWIDT